MIFKISLRDMSRLLIFLQGPLQNLCRTLSWKLYFLGKLVSSAVLFFCTKKWILIVDIPLTLTPASVKEESDYLSYSNNWRLKRDIVPCLTHHKFSVSIYSPNYPPQFELSLEEMSITTVIKCPVNSESIPLNVSQEHYFLDIVLGDPQSHQEEKVVSVVKLIWKMLA